MLVYVGSSFFAKQQYHFLLVNLLNKPFIFQYKLLKNKMLTLNRVATHSGKFLVEENLREIQGILIYFLNSGKLREVLIFSKKFKEVLRF